VVIVVVVVFIIVRLHRIPMVKTIVFANIIIFSFFLPKPSSSDFHETWQKCTPGWPYYTDPVPVTLTYFSRSQTYFYAKIAKLHLVITLLFAVRFWSYLAGMAYRWTPSCWPTLGDLDLLVQVKLDIGPKFVVIVLAKTVNCRNILVVPHDGYY